MHNCYHPLHIRATSLNTIARVVIIVRVGPCDIRLIATKRKFIRFFIDFSANMYLLIFFDFYNKSPYYRDIPDPIYYT